MNFDLHGAKPLPICIASLKDRNVVGDSRPPSFMMFSFMEFVNFVYFTYFLEVQTHPEDLWVMKVYAYLADQFFVADR